MKELFVDYHTAVKLKEKGFNEPCLATIDQTEFLHIKGTKYPIRGAMCYHDHPAPLFQQVLDWLDEKGLRVVAEPYSDDDWEYTIYIKGNLPIGRDRFKSRMEALQSGINKALEII